MGDLTEGERIYAIGDVHGRSDLLDLVLGRIRDDLAARRHDRPRIVLLGDYVDRGPDSRGVIDRLIGLEAGEIATTFLFGNHDACALGFLDQPGEHSYWMEANMGGAATLASYGVEASFDVAPERVRDAFAAALPGAHAAFLRRCSTHERRGAYLFVHAGIRPGVPLEAQVAQDLIWIREPFLSSKLDHGVKVVHGHTIVPFVEHRPNRIAVDTGAVRTGVLSCVVLEGDEVALLTSAGLRPLPEGTGLGIDRLGQSLAAGLGRLARGFGSGARGRSRS